MCLHPRDSCLPNQTALDEPVRVFQGQFADFSHFFALRKSSTTIPGFISSTL
jgi:hypothetical protein